MSTTTEDLMFVAQRIYETWDTEVAPAVRESWDEMKQRQRDNWVLVAQSAIATVRTIPLPMLLHCPECGERHIDEGEFAIKPHHTHACQHCGLCWRPAIAPTCGVQFLPGFKTENNAP